MATQELSSGRRSRSDGDCRASLSALGVRQRQESKVFGSKQEEQSE
jgi:hypothetical protein